MSDTDGVTAVVVLAASDRFFEEFIPTCKQIEIDYDKQCCGVFSAFKKSKSTEFKERWSLLLEQVDDGWNLLRGVSTTSHVQVNNMLSYALAGYFSLSRYVSARIDVLTCLIAKENGSSIPASAYTSFLHTAEDNRKQLVETMGPYEELYRQVKNNLQKNQKDNDSRQKVKIKKPFHGSFLHFLLSAVPAQLVYQRVPLAESVFYFISRYYPNLRPGTNETALIAGASTFISFTILYVVFYKFIGWVADSIQKR